MHVCGEALDFEKENQELSWLPDITATTKSNTLNHYLRIPKGRSDLQNQIVTHSCDFLFAVSSLGHVLHWFQGTQFTHLQLIFTSPLKPSSSKALKDTVLCYTENRVFLHETESFMAKWDKKRSKEEDAVRPTYTKSNYFNPPCPIESRLCYLKMSLLSFITAGTKFSAQTRTPRFSKTVKRITLHSREILFPENHILSPSLSLQGICTKTESFSDGSVQTQLFWTGFQCHCCNNLTAQQCGCNSPSLGFQEKAVFTVPPYMHWGKVPVPPSPKRKLLCNPPCFTRASSLWALLWN